MKLFTYQTKEAFEILKTTGELKITSPENRKTYLAFEPKIDAWFNPFAFGYKLVIWKMQNTIKCDDASIISPIWAWKLWEGKSKPKRNLNKMNKGKVLIYFEVPDDEVLLSDFDYYENIAAGGLNFIFNGDKDLIEASIKNKSDVFDFKYAQKCFDKDQLKEATSIQATLWKLKFDKVYKIKFL